MNFIFYYLSDKTHPRPYKVLRIRNISTDLRRRVALTKKKLYTYLLRMEGRLKLLIQELIFKSLLQSLDMQIHILQETVGISSGLSVK